MQRWRWWYNINDGNTVDNMITWKKIHFGKKPHSLHQNLVLFITNPQHGTNQDVSSWNVKNIELTYVQQLLTTWKSCDIFGFLNTFMDEDFWLELFRRKYIFIRGWWAFISQFKESRTILSILQCIMTLFLSFILFLSAKW